MRTAATLLAACAIAWLGVESSAAVKVKTQFTKILRLLEGQDLVVARRRAGRGQDGAHGR